MLLLLFQLGQDRFALDAGSIVEVLPLVSIRKTIRSPPGVAGTLNYHGSLVPVIDLSDLLLGRPAAPHLSTRVVLANHVDEKGSSRLVGLVTENVTQTLRCEAADLVSPGIATSDAAYLGRLVKGPDGLVQIIELGRLLPDSLRLSLLDEPEAA